MNRFKFAYKNVGEIPTNKYQLEEIHGKQSPTGGELRGLYWKMAFDTPLAFPQIIDTDKLLKQSIQQQMDPKQIAMQAYYEAFNGATRAIEIAKRLNSSDPEKIKQFMHEQVIEGIAYDPSDPDVLEHERRHRSGGKLNINTLVNNLAQSLPSNISYKERLAIAAYFIYYWTVSYTHLTLPTIYSV